MTIQSCLDKVVNAGEDGEEAGAHGAALLDPPEAEDDRPLVFLVRNIVKYLSRYFLFEAISPELV